MPWRGAITIETKLESPTKYPKIMGIKYDPQNFSYASMTTTKWSWKANPLALRELQAAGGRIQVFGPTQQLSVAGKRLLESELQANVDNQFMVEHAQQSWQGLELILPARVTLKNKLHLEITFEAAQPSAFTMLLNVGVGSQMQLEREIHYPPASTRLNLLTCGKVEADSRLNLVDRLQGGQSPQQSLWMANLYCQKDAQLDWSFYPEVKGKVLGKCITVLEEQGSSAVFKVGQFGRQDDWIGIQGLIDHRAPKTFSRIKMRGVLYEKAQVYFTSIGKINKGAHGANAAQKSRLMTIEPHAKGSVNPLLIIDENDVQAGHAASVGQYDEEALYYLLSRGLAEVDAKQILINNFMEPVLPNETVEK
ncbi:SufD family Fe-S cluster assembly protein [Pediococcus pentosaceus]|uniref:SufD family Fe-S cluster assembly protein n=2 Tax=Pediococcus pentosaceus TaxID=1255 RepID=UPI001F253E20|nr:SufD family Fe-S cluster assembly protein [Pediococcus pentosaceus]